MKNHGCKILALASLLVILGTAPSFTQSTDMMRVKIPFEFVVGNRTLPAGVYTLEQKQRILAIDAPKPHTSMFLATEYAMRKPNDRIGQLVFHRYGTTHFPSEGLDSAKHCWPKASEVVTRSRTGTGSRPAACDGCSPVAVNGWFHSPFLTRRQARRQMRRDPEV